MCCGASKANKRLYSRQLRNWDKECAVQSISDVAKLFPSSVLTGSSRRELGTLHNYTNSDLLLSKRRQSGKPWNFSNLIISPRATYKTNIAKRKIQGSVGIWSCKRKHTLKPVHVYLNKTLQLHKNMSWVWIWNNGEFWVLLPPLFVNENQIMSLNMMGNVLIAW